MGPPRSAIGIVGRKRWKGQRDTIGRGMKVSKEENHQPQLRITWDESRRGYGIIWPRARWESLP